MVRCSGISVQQVHRLGVVAVTRKHRRNQEGAAPASDAVARASVPHLHFFFLGFALMQLDSCRIGFDSRRTRLIQLESGRIGHIRSYWPATDTVETCRKWPKSALNMVGKAEIITSEAQLCVSCLLLSLFCESRHSNVFFKNILIVKIYRKYK